MYGSSLRAGEGAAKADVGRTFGYAELAALLSYPDDATMARCAAWLASWGEAHPETAGFLAAWRDRAAPMQTWELQELYTRTFDLNPCCSLDVGYYLFGDDYQRGAFMARLCEELDRAGVPRSAELPDHLPNLLRWIERRYGTEDHIELASECLVPVLLRMEEAFAAKDAAEQTGADGGGNPYRLMIRATIETLVRDLRALGVECSPVRPSSPVEAAAAGSEPGGMGSVPHFVGCSPACASRGEK